MSETIAEDSIHLETVKSIKVHKKSLLESRKLFIDDEFPTELGLEERPVLWKRIKDIDEKAALYFDGNPLKGSIEPGILQNANLASVFLAMSNHLRLLHFVFPADQNFDSQHYCGLFYFRFWKMGNWVYIMIDDRVPILIREKEKKKPDKTKMKDSSFSKTSITDTACENTPEKKTEQMKGASEGDVKSTGISQLGEETGETKSLKKGCSVQESGDGVGTIREPTQEKSDPESTDQGHHKSMELSKDVKSPDDRVRTLKESNSKHFFMHGLDTEGNCCYWPTLLEKAYAKLCGGYDKLKQLELTDILRDLTGGLIEAYNSNFLPPNFFLELKSCSDKNCIIVATGKTCEDSKRLTPMKPEILAVTQVIFADFRKLLGRDKMVGFVRLKACSGVSAWEENWISATKDWEILPLLTRQKLKMEARDKNEFYLTYKNFVASTSELYISTPPDGQNYNCEGYFGSWIKPRLQYNISHSDELKFHEFQQHKIWIRDPNDLNSNLSVEGLISLSRDGACSCSGKFTPCSAMQIHVFPLTREGDVPVTYEFFRYASSVGCSDLSALKDLTVRFSLHPGHYLVIPVLIHSCWSKPVNPGTYLLRIVTPPFIKSKDKGEQQQHYPLADGCVSLKTNFDLTESVEGNERVEHPTNKGSVTSFKKELKGTEKAKGKR